MKKYKQLQDDSGNISVQLNLTNEKLNAAEKDKLELKNILAQREEEILHKQTEISHKDEKIRLLNRNDEDQKKTNAELTVWINEFKSYSTVLAENNKRAIMELEKQNQKVNELNKSLTQKNAVNLLMIKKAKTKISDKKLLRSLDKLGIIL